MALDNLQTPKRSESPEAQNASLFTLAGTIGAWVGATGFFVAASQSNTWQFSVMGIGGSILGLVLLVAHILNNNGKTNLATWISIISAGLTFAFFATLTTNMSLVMAFLMFILAINVSIQIFHGREVIAGIIVSLLGTALIIMAGNLETSFERIALELWLQEVFIIASGLVGMLLSINTLRRFEFGTLRAQLVAAFLIISIIPIMLIQASQYLNIQNTLRNQANSDLAANANTVISGVERALLDIQRDVLTTARLPILRQLLDEDPTVSANALATLDAIKSQNRYITSFGVLDANGVNLLDTQLNLKGTSESFSSYFIAGQNNKQPYISDVYYDSIANKSYLYISVPIVDQEDDSLLIGILRARVDGQILQDTVTNLAKSLGEDHSVLLATQQQVILAHSRDDSLDFKTLTGLRENIIQNLQNTKQLPDDVSPESLNAGLGLYARALPGLAQNPFFEANALPGQPTNQVVAGDNLSIKPWVVFVMRNTTTITEPILQQLTSTSIIVFIIVLAVIGGASLTASFITSPINELVKITERVGEGAIKVRIQSARKDEIGTLAHTFDNATEQIEKLLSSLEDRVNERTHALADLNRTNEKRATQLQAIAEVARAITSLQDPEQLLPIIAERISDTFGFYHVGIFLIDQSGVYAVLHASNSEGGRKMLERRHRLRVGQVGIVGYVTSTGHPRIALDVGDDAIYFNNPDLPLTRSEMALPLTIGEKVIGALDVQSTESAAFTDNDINILTLLADQISVAIQNARLFEETRQALAETRALYSASVKEGWKLITQARANGYRYSNGRVEAILGRSQTNPDAQVIEIPVISRGETFGRIKIKLPENQAETTDEEQLQLYGSIAERLALALDNARLVEESQRRADLERAISKMTGEIGSSTNIDGILQTTVEQIGHLVKNAEVIIQLTPDKTDQA